MRRMASRFGDRSLALGVGLACGLTLLWPSAGVAQDGPGLAGRWTLNPDLSQFPRELGFDADWARAGARGAEPSPGAGPGGGGAGSFLGRPESQDEARRKQVLTDEVRTPSTRLTIVETASTVTISDDKGRMRTFRPDGRENTLDLDGVPVVVSARRDGGRLQVVYRVAQGRDLRYLFSRVQNPAQLVVEVQFVERGGGDRVRRVYEPATEPERPATSATAPPTAPPASGAVPASGRAAAEPFDQRPDAALKGLTRLGVVVEGLGSQAAACGLTDSSVEAAVSKRLTEAGLRVVRNSDEDTYLYVNVISGSLPNGCVSRYDVILYTHTTATLSYRDRPVLVQVSLLNKGGITGGAAAGHGAAVLREVEEYVDAFVARIRDANR